MESDSMQGMKNYAVVQFLSDNTFSEIPIVWLSEEDDVLQCWWPPRNSNSATLIANCASPNHDTWSKHEVKLTKYCSSLESARKSASDANYHTTDEETLGRGKRPFVPNSLLYSDEEIQPRKSKIKKGGKTFAEKNCSNIVSTTLPLCPDNFGLNNNILCNVSQKYCSSRFNEISSQRDKSYANYFNDSSSQQGIESDLSSKQKQKEIIQLDDIPIVLEEYVPCLDEKDKWYLTLNTIAENTKKLLRMHATLNITLRDMSQRLQKLENERTDHALNSVVNDGLIAQFLPLDTVEAMKQFNFLLESTEEAVIQFKQYLSKTGGYNPKDNIQRILKKIFTNKCAMNCSMKGIRNNFRVGDLYMIKILRRELTSRHANLTETEFDSVVAEWLRFAKQRKTRNEKKEKENINEENNNGRNNEQQH